MRSEEPKVFKWEPEKTTKEPKPLEKKTREDNTGGQSSSEAKPRLGKLLICDARGSKDSNEEGRQKKLRELFSEVFEDNDKQRKAEETWGTLFQSV